MGLQRVRHDWATFTRSKKKVSLVLFNRIIKYIFYKSNSVFYYFVYLNYTNHCRYTAVSPVLKDNTRPSTLANRDSRTLSVCDLWLLLCYFSSSSNYLFIILYVSVLPCAFFPSPLFTFTLIVYFIRKSCPLQLSLVSKYFPNFLLSFRLWLEKTIYASVTSFLFYFLSFICGHATWLARS